MDLAETDDHLVLKADLPGLDADDVEIEVQDGVLTVSGERKTEHESSSNGYHRVERSYGRFSRSLSLPQGIDAGQVQAEFDKGVLEVRIPKPAERKPHRVQIGASVEGKAREK
jgi:HSP20 family protein